MSLMPKLETSPAAEAPPRRLVSLDAFRGFVMLAMASGGFAISRVYDKHPSIISRFDDTPWGVAWDALWKTLGEQLSHVEWTGCTAWDLIQPSFTFIVGAALPFSLARRQSRGDSAWEWLGHVLVRSIALILLGIFLRSRGARMTNFTFEDTLTQIGLGYTFVALLVNRGFFLQLVALLAILGGYWNYFYQQPVPVPEGNDVTRYLTEVRTAGPAEWSQFGGLKAHWNKHTNAAAEFDRKFLNKFPRSEEEWNGKQFWINGGGYQTLSFIPTAGTMILGLMAGQLLRSLRTQTEKFQRLILGGAICFVVAMACDTTIWPVSPETLGLHGWSLCPVVKRIWTPTWTVFSGGWCLMSLAMFYWVIDIKGFRGLSFPLVVVGMNSIVMYCMHELIFGWVGSMLKIHLTTLDAINFRWGDKLRHTRTVEFLFNDAYRFAPILASMAILFVLWLICLWLYRRKLFVRI